MTHCVIEPMHLESFEIYCEENDIHYEYYCEDGEYVIDGLHVFMKLSDYVNWWTADEHWWKRNAWNYQDKKGGGE